jgi:hypothetical protein
LGDLEAELEQLTMNTRRAPPVIHGRLWLTAC